MITPKEAEFLKVIHRLQKEKGYSPSFEELRTAMGLKSKSGIHRFVIQLEVKGFLRLLRHRARTIELTQKAYLFLKTGSTEGGEDYDMLATMINTSALGTIRRVMSENNFRSYGQAIELIIDVYLEIGEEHRRQIRAQKKLRR